MPTYDYECSACGHKFEEFQSITEEPKKTCPMKGGHRVHLPLPGASPDALEVAVVEDELIVRAGSRRRSIPLPPRIARLALESARIDDGTLVVAFREPA